MMTDFTAYLNPGLPGKDGGVELNRVTVHVHEWLIVPYCTVRRNMLKQSAKEP